MSAEFSVPDFDAEGGVYSVGDIVVAQWTEDGEWYTAEILEYYPDEEIYLVVFTEYGNEQECTVDMMRLPNNAMAQLLEESVIEEPVVRKTATAALPQATLPKKPIPASMRKKSVAPPARKKPAAPPKKSVPSPRGSAVPQEQAGWSSRRKAAKKRQRQAGGQKAVVDYDADESVIHGVENMELILEQAECELFGRLEVAEKTATTPEEVVGWASLLTELAVIPVTPAADADEYWAEALAKADEAMGQATNDAEVLTRTAHVTLRYALYLLTVKQDRDGAEAEFRRAIEQYRSVFLLAPTRAVLKFIVHAFSWAAGLNLNHFLGVFANGYSGALIRARDEEDAMVMVQHHLDMLNELPTAGIAHPIFRARCFGVLRMVVLGYAVAVVDDLPEDQAWLLLALWDAMVRLEKVDEAALLGFYLLKLNDEVNDIDMLIDAIPGIEEYIVAVNYNKLAENVTNVSEAEMNRMAQAELDEVLATMNEYNPEEILMSIREIQAELVRVEYKHAGEPPGLKLSEISMDQLFELAYARHHVAQFFAARTYLGLLAAERTRGKAISALWQEFEGPRALASICIAERPNVVLPAAQAVLFFVEGSQSRLGELAETGLVEACVFMMANSAVGIARSAASTLLLMVESKRIFNLLLDLKMQLGPALLDQVFSTDNQVVVKVSELLVKLFRLQSAADIETIAIDIIPDIAEEDLRDVVDIVSEQLPAAARGQASPSKLARPPPKKLPTPAKKTKKNASEQEIVRGRGFTQQVEAKYGGPALVLSPVADDSDSDEVFQRPAGKLSSVPSSSGNDNNAPKKGGRAQAIKMQDSYDNTYNSGLGEGDSSGYSAYGDDSGMEIHLTEEAQMELERELAGMDDIDTAYLSEMSLIEAEQLEEDGEDQRVVALLKMGAVLEEQVNERLDDGEIDAAEDCIDAAVSKYQALLLLSPTSHVGLRRMADALLRKAEFREGPEADMLYARAIEVYDTDIEYYDDEESHSHKVAAMIDRAKNKAAEEDAKGSNFSQTRKLLSEAKQASQHVRDREDFINSINEVLTYVRLQTDARREEKAMQEQERSGTAKRAANPDAMLRKGSMMVAQPKQQQQQQQQQQKQQPKQQQQQSRAGKAGGTQSRGVVDEKERLQNALAAKKPKAKVGKLSKEGGGKSLLGRKTWKERLFELSESSLEYYEKSNTTEKPKGTISLYEVTTVRSATVPNRPHCFEVVTEARKFPIQAQSEEDKEDWIKSIMWNVDRQKLMRKITKMG